MRKFGELGETGENWEVWWAREEMGWSVESLETGLNWADWCWGELGQDQFWGTELRSLDWAVSHPGSGAVSGGGSCSGDPGDRGDIALLIALLCPHPDMWHPGFFLEESQDLPVVPPPSSCALTVKDLLLSGSSDNVSPCPCPQPCPLLDPDHPPFPSLFLPIPTLVPFPFLMLVCDPCPFLAHGTFTMVPGVPGARWG